MSTARMTAFLIACLLLLLSPGPTNTLMAVAGAQGGLRRVLGLLFAEVAGYLTTILPLLVFGEMIDHRWPAAALGLKLAMAAWVLFLAVKLWTMSLAQGADGGVTARRVYLTTVLNPKAWVFALVLLPGGGRDELGLRLGLLMLLIVGVALVWGSGGSAFCLREGGEPRRLLVQRAASIWLAVISVMLVTQVARV